MLPPAPTSSIEPDAPSKVEPVPTFNAARLPEVGTEDTPDVVGSAEDQTKGVPRTSLQSDRPPSIESNRLLLNGEAPSVVEDTQTYEELKTELERIRADHERVELRRQEETHDCLERIDALQAKLQYLARETSVSARQAIVESGKDLMQKRLAERDERIALLLEEGTKLSKSEVTQASTIRNMRAKAAEDTNSIADLRRKLNVTEAALSDKTSENVRLETERTDAQTRIARLARFEREVAGLKQQCATKEEDIKRLQREVREANDRADDDEKSRIAASLEQHQRITQSLRDDLANAKIEQGIRDDRARADIVKVREQLQKEAERNSGAELGLRNEISTLESRMEVMRERTEEASTGIKGDAQAKLMRQIEILQSQYAVASENWQGIEASLQSRVTALEGERDESSRHETEARKKAREAGTTSRRLQHQLDDTAQRCRLFEHDIAEQRAHADKLQSRADEFEKTLLEARATFDREKQGWNASLCMKLDEEKAKWQHQTTPINTHAELSLFSNSPHTSNQRRTSTMDVPGVSSRRNGTKPNFELNLSGLRSSANGRKVSGIPSMRNTSDMLLSPTSVDSGHSPPFTNHVPTTMGHAAAPSIHAIEADDNLDNVSCSSHRRTINDMFSASTAAAGPSVQLVERMSASVRRLETEKAASKEELARLSAQRDEARKEVVSLMQEVEAKRDIDKRAERLKNDLDHVRKRYATTLEMYGEESERVEELEADVCDLKQMYRDLVESTTG